MTKFPKKLLLVQTDSLEGVIKNWEMRKDEEDWLGLGSVTVKSIGMVGLKAIRGRCPDNVILADLKSMDTGFLEVEVAALAGADVITVSGLADDSTIIGAVEAARKYDVKIMADLVNAGLDRAKTLEKNGVHYMLCKPEQVKELKGLNIPIASYNDDAQIRIEEIPSRIPSKQGKKKRLEFGNPILQVALDLTELKDALRIAEQSNMGGVDWLEVGTPLIKCEGAKAVRELRKKFPGKILVADLKTLANSAEEVAIAALAGADIVGISGSSDDLEIAKAVEQAKKMGVHIMADLIAISNPVSRAAELERLGADILEFHISIDKQLSKEYAGYPFPLVEEVCDSVQIPVAVAGGMRAKTAPLAVKSGAKIVVVGGGITHVADPKAATENIKQAMKTY